MLAARSDTRNTAASAQSSAVIGRPSGCMAADVLGDLLDVFGRAFQPAGRHEVRERHRRGADRVRADAERGALDRDRPW